ncbi:MAG: hypothetical protein WA899_06625, partial [Candidatus Sulfotelmatobacter sp.]
GSGQGAERGEIGTVSDYEDALRVLAPSRDRNLSKRFVRCDTGGRDLEGAKLSPSSQTIKQTTLTELCFKELGAQIVLVKHEPNSEELQKQPY